MRGGMDPNASAGCVNWPVTEPQWKDAGEGGMTAYALWLEAPKLGLVSASLGIEVKETETVIAVTGGTPDDAAQISGMLREGLMASAILPLGETGGPWIRDERWFVVESTALTAACRTTP